MFETRRSRYLTLGLSLVAFAIGGCAVQASDDASSVSSTDNELLACGDVASLELLNAKVRDQGSKGGAVALSSSQTLSVLPGHTYVITADLHDKDKDPNHWVNYPGVVLSSSFSEVTTAVTSPQTFAILADTTQQQEATFTVAANACNGGTGKLSFAPTADFGRCKGAVSTYNFKVTR